eukprot:m.231107 g.231107  ORF g.231107 m.231107 type:complete len:593 (+) comp17063_c5_seq2:631-2409(+)
MSLQDLRETLHERRQLSNSALDLLCEAIDQDLSQSPYVSHTVAEVLMFLCKHGDANQLMIVLSRCDINQLILPQEYDHSTILHIAAGFGRQDIVHSLVPLGARADVPDVHGFVALHNAASQGQVHVVDDLLRSAPHTINAVDRNGNTPLHLAAMKNDRAFCLKLMRQGALVALTNQDGLTPPQLATEPEVTAVMDSDFNGPELIEAINQGSFCTLQSLLTRSNVNHTMPTQKQGTLLHLAVTVQNHAIVNLLLEQGADVRRKDIQGMAPLHYAAAACNIEAARSLLVHRADINDTDLLHNTPLLKAVKCCCYYALMYRQKLASLAAPGRTNSYTPSQDYSPVATRQRSATYPRLQDTSIHRVDSMNSAFSGMSLTTPHDSGPFSPAENKDGLMMTFETKDEPVFSPQEGSASFQLSSTQPTYHYQAPPSPYLAPQQCEAALHQVATQYRMACRFVEFLLLHGADPSIPDSKGNTALHCAVTHSVDDLAALLLQHPATDVNLCNNEGNTPLHIACQQDAEHIVELLLPRVHDDVLREMFKAKHAAGDLTCSDSNAMIEIKHRAANKQGLTPLDLCRPGSNTLTLLLAANALSF